MTDCLKRYWMKQMLLAGLRIDSGESMVACLRRHPPRSPKDTERRCKQYRGHPRRQTKKCRHLRSWHDAGASTFFPARPRDVHSRHPSYLPGRFPLITQPTILPCAKHTQNEIKRNHKFPPNTSWVMKNMTD